MHYVRYFAQVVPAFAWLVGAWMAPALRRLSRRPFFSRLPDAHRVVSVLVASLVLVGYPAVLVFGLSPPIDCWGDLRLATRAFSAAAPDARVLPTTANGKDEISIPVSAASRFYFEMPLVPFDPNDASQPPLVLFRHQEHGPAEAEAFEAVHHYAIAWRGKEYTLYRTR